MFCVLILSEPQRVEDLLVVKKYEILSLEPLADLLVCLAGRPLFEIALLEVGNNNLC